MEKQSGQEARDNRHLTTGFLGEELYRNRRLTCLYYEFSSLTLDQKDSVEE